MSEFKRIPPEQALELRKKEGAVVVDIRDPQASPPATSPAPGTWITTRSLTSSATPTSTRQPWWSAITAIPAKVLLPTW